MDVASDTISGVGEPGVEVQVCLNIPNNCVSRYTTPDLNGDWSVSYNGVGNEDLIPGSNGWAAQPYANVNRTWVDWNVMNPTFSDRAYPNDEVEAFDWPLGSTLTLTIDRGAIHFVDDTQVVGVNPNNPNQTYVFYGLNGRFDIQPGDVVSLSDGTTTKTHMVTNLRFTDINLAADTVAGFANPGVQVDVWVCDNHGYCVNRSYTSNSTTGSFTANFHDPDGKGNPAFDIVPGTWVDFAGMGCTR